MTGTKSERNGKEEWARGTLHTTVKRICREFIKIYAIISYGEGIKGLRERVYISCFNNGKNRLEYTQINNFYTSQNKLPVYQKLSPFI